MQQNERFPLYSTAIPHAGTVSKYYFQMIRTKSWCQSGRKSITNNVGQKQIGTQQLTAIESKSPAAIMQGGAQAGKVDGTGAGYRYGELTDGRD